MFEQMKKGFMSMVLIVGVLMTGTTIPVFAGTSESIIGAMSSIDGTAKTFKICGQEVDTGNISSINMSSRTISFSNLRSGISADVYVKAKSISPAG